MNSLIINLFCYIYILHYDISYRYFLFLIVGADVSNYNIFVYIIIYIYIIINYIYNNIFVYNNLFQFLIFSFNYLKYLLLLCNKHKQ
jgi:hypothetical protein